MSKSKEEIEMAAEVAFDARQVAVPDKYGVQRVQTAIGEITIQAQISMDGLNLYVAHDDDFGEEDSFFPRFKPLPLIQEALQSFVYGDTNRLSSEAADVLRKFCDDVLGLLKGYVIVDASEERKRRQRKERHA